MCTISIILPVYNSEKSIRFCLDSILTQTFSDFELIIIDDGSEDATAKIISDEYSQDSRIRYIRQVNQGQSKARNRGLKEKKGEYVAFIDSDDWWDVNFLEIMLQFIIKNNLDIVECDFILKSKYKIENETVTKYSPVIFGEREILRDYLYRGLKAANSSYSVCNKLYKAQYFNEIKFGEISYAEDYLINFEIFQRIERFQKISYYGYNYYREDESTTRASLKNEDFNIVINSQKVYEQALEIGDSYLIEYSKVRLEHCYFSLYIKAVKYGCSFECRDQLPFLRRKMKENIPTIIRSEISFKRKMLLLLMSNISFLIPIKQN